ncbi:heat-inducible transcriptional repressor HrcA [Eubacteriales bacterium KG127]
MELSERKLKILQAIISDYIMTAEPVGSRTLSKKYQLGISPATIRNEMSDLEDLGFLTHPHTSAGRVPSDKAYRLYVNELMGKQEITESEKQIIAQQLRSDVNEFDKTIRKAARLLSDITSLASFVMTPSQEENKLEFVKILPVDNNTVVMMIVAENGRISNTTLRLDEAYTEEYLSILSKNITYRFKGQTLSQVLRQNIIETFASDLSAMNKLEEFIMPDFMRTLEEMLDVNLYMDGLSNIFDIPEYSDIGRAREFLRLFDDKEALTKTIMNRDEGVVITIGDENQSENLQDYSLITATYSVDGHTVGKIGVIGPKRMKYGEITSIVKYLTENINDTFSLDSWKGDKIDE